MLMSEDAGFASVGVGADKNCGADNGSKLGQRQIWPALSPQSSQHMLLGTGAKWCHIYSKTALTFFSFLLTSSSPTTWLTFSTKFATHHPL